MTDLLLPTLAFLAMGFCDWKLTGPLLSGRFVGSVPSSEQIEEFALELTSGIRHWLPFVGLMISIFFFDPILVRVISWAWPDLAAAIFLAFVFLSLVYLPCWLVATGVEEYLKVFFAQGADSRFLTSSPPRGPGETTEVTGPVTRAAAGAARDEETQDEEMMWRTGLGLSFMAMGYGLAVIAVAIPSAGIAFGLFLTHHRLKIRSKQIKKWRLEGLFGEGASPGAPQAEIA